MIALSMLLAVLFWAMVSFFVARAVSWQLKGQWPQRIALLALFVLFMVTPIADELLGKQQFEKLCREVEREGVKYYGKVELGPEFYFEDGTPKWVARDFSLGEYNRASDAEKWIETVITSIAIDTEVNATAIEITKHTRQFFSANTGSLLAEYSWLTTSGGLLSKGLEKPFLVRDACGLGKRIYNEPIYENISHRSDSGE